MARTFRRDPYQIYKGKIFADGHKTMASTPSWWVKTFMNKPKRCENSQLCRKILKGADCDNLAFPTGNRKPHEYYW